MGFLSHIRKSAKKHAEQRWCEIFEEISCCVSAAVELEYSLDLGLSWQPLVRECLPTSPDCSSYTLQRLLLSDTYNKWGRVTLPIFPHARSLGSIKRLINHVRMSVISETLLSNWCHVFRSPATRFRWFQQAPFDKQQTWALDNLYIGDGCPDMCSGHGRCQQSSCL